MSQRFSLYDDLTVSQNLAFFGGGYGLSTRRLAERVAWVLDMAGLRGDERRLLVEDTAAAPLIHQVLHAAGLTVERLETIAFSLEDVFVLLIEQEEQHHDSART